MQRIFSRIRTQRRVEGEHGEDILGAIEGRRAGTDHLAREQLGRQETWDRAEACPLLRGRDVDRWMSTHPANQWCYLRASRRPSHPGTSTNHDVGRGQRSIRQSQQDLQANGVGAAWQASRRVCRGSQNPGTHLRDGVDRVDSSSSPDLTHTCEFDQQFTTCEPLLRYMLHTARPFVGPSVH